MNMTEEAIKITGDLVKIKSITFNEREAADYIADSLENLGFNVEIDGFNNVIGELKGNGNGGRILFLGHHDIVEEGDHSLWTHPPFSGEVFGDELWGRGSADEKGGIGSFLAAMKKINKDFPDGLKGDILFISTREETMDVTARGIAKILDERKIEADFCIVLEPTDVNIALGHKGIAVLEITSHGKSAHSSVPHEGINAIYHMAHILTELEKMQPPNHAPLGKGVQSVGVIRGGIRSNIIPEKCVIEVDRRIITGETAESVYDEVYGALAPLKESIPDLNFEIKIKSLLYATHIDADHPAVKLVKEACEDVGYQNEIGYMEGNTDGGFILNIAKIPTLILGPGSMSVAHAIDERVKISELGKAAEIYYRIIEKKLL